MYTQHNDYVLITAILNIYHTLGKGIFVEHEPNVDFVIAADRMYIVERNIFSPYDNAYLFGILRNNQMVFTGLTKTNA